MTSRLSGSDKTMPAALTAVAMSGGFALGSITGTLIVKAYGVQEVFLVTGAARVTGAFLVFLLLVVLPAAQRRLARAQGAG